MYGKKKRIQHKKHTNSLGFVHLILILKARSLPEAPHCCIIGKICMLLLKENFNATFSFCTAKKITLLWNKFE